MRAAVVIGVNKPKSPSPLKGAVDDANAFADWLLAEGFAVKRFTDAQAPVTFNEVFAEVERLVKDATFSQVVIYFAGHGWQAGGSELWLLSGAPNNPGEAISVEASVMAARESGLTNVVFVSDACRSIPATMQGARVDGLSVFPILPLNKLTRPEVDRLFATLPSLVAVEAAKADDGARREGIFTRELMRGYRNPPQHVVERVTENGTVIDVVTNRKMKGLIRELVEDAAFEEMPKAGQLPEFILESVTAYIGRVQRDVTPFNLPTHELWKPAETTFRTDRPMPEDIDTFRNERANGGAGQQSLRKHWHGALAPVAAVAQQAVDAAVLGNTAQTVAHAVRVLGEGTGLSGAIERYASGGAVDHFETQTGFVVIGAQVSAAYSKVVLVDQPGSDGIRIHPGPAPASVLIEFDDRRGTVLPALRGYIGHIYVDATGVSNVSYVPSTNSDRWIDYQAAKDGVEVLRAAVAAAAALGVLRIDPREAQSFGHRIRQLKVFDPTLGLYAAYAYAAGGLSADIASVAHFMRSDLQVELFDVAMLERRGIGSFDTPSLPITPFCPVLRQGWSLLSVREARLPSAVEKAGDYLLPALWTTFAPQGVTLLREAMKRGDVQ